MTSARTQTRLTSQLGFFQSVVDRRLEQFKKDDAVKRFWSKDATLWPGDGKKHTEITERLGWLDAPREALRLASELSTFSHEMLGEDYAHVVLLGMGGSSLAPEVFQHTFGNPKGFPTLLVLDTTDPDAIAGVEARVDLERTLFIVASKSGTTIETHTLFLYFYDRLKQITGDRAGEHFIAITDPDTGLVKTAERLGFRKVFLAPPDVGGRYSALTNFGLVPAALLGAEVASVLESVSLMAKEAGPEASAPENPAFILGAAMGELMKAGRDKLILVMPPELSSFSDWIEQLVAESTGKQGLGIVPVSDEPWVGGASYGSDRLFVFTELESSGAGLFEKEKKELTAASQPWVSIRLKNRYEIGAAFFLWEMATAVSAIVLEIDPFDQPNVAESKDNTSRILNAGTGRKFSDTPDDLSLEQEKKLNDALFHLFSSAKAGDYVAFMLYAPLTDHTKELFSLAREVTLKQHKLASTLGFGPRYLHSTGQLHKGGASSGLFIQLVHDSDLKIPIPEKPYTFEDLKQAQALGDYDSLKKKGRRIVRVRIRGPWERGLHRFLDVLGQALLKTSVNGNRS